MKFTDHKTCIKCYKPLNGKLMSKFCCGIRYTYKNDGFMDYDFDDGIVTKVKFSIDIPSPSKYSRYFIQKSDESYWLYLTYLGGSNVLCFDHLVDLQIPFDFSILDNTLCMKYIKNVDLL